MNYSYFVFALFVFFLLCLFMQFYAKKIRPKANNEMQKEQKLFQLYQNMEEMMDDLEAYVQSVREEFEGDKLKMAGMMDQMEQIQNLLTQQKQAFPQQPKRKRGRPRKNPIKAEQKGEPAKPVLVKSKYEQVQRLISQGLGEEGIAQALGISKGEVSLILGLKRSV